MIHQREAVILHKQDTKLFQRLGRKANVNLKVKEPPFLPL